MKNINIQNKIEHFLENPFGYEKEEIIEEIRLSNETSFAQKIFERCIKDNHLVLNISPKVLSCLGFWQYEPVIKVALNYIDKEILNQNHKNYSKELTSFSSHDLNKEACLSLINFDLSEYEEVIIEKVLSCNNRHLFPEFTPSVISKINGEYTIEQFYNENKNIVSCDCFGGVILGIALSGNKKLFKEILWNDYWELAETGTGNSFWAYIGFKILNISLKEIINEISSEIKSLSEEEIEYRIEVLISMILRKLDNPVIPISLIDFNNSKENNKEILDLLLLKNLEFYINDEYLKKEFIKVLKLLE